jgi:peptide/nickel transport system substrate-binding protein
LTCAPPPSLNNDEVVSVQQVAGQLRGIPSARAIDDLTVEITTSVPEPILPSRLAIMRPHEPKAWADLGAEGYGSQPVGTGPYKISVWDNEKIRGTAFAEGWRVPKIENLVVDLLPENASRRQALCSNQADIANVLTPDDKGPIESCGHKVVLSPTNNTINLILRHLVEDSPVHDVRVRQALNHAYDKEGFTSTVLAGTTRPAAMPATSTMSGWFEDIKPYAYDPAKAKQLLAEAGYPDGFDMLAEIVVSTGEFADTF